MTVVEAKAHAINTEPWAPLPGRVKVVPGAQRTVLTSSNDATKWPTPQNKAPA